jgi:hypothetical protein
MTNPESFTLTGRKNEDDGAECSSARMAPNSGYSCSYELPPFIGRLASKCRTQKRRDTRQKQHQNKMYVKVTKKMLRQWGGMLV